MTHPDPAMDMVITRLDEVSSRLGSIEQSLAERRGAERALQWVFGLALTGLGAAVATLWDTVKRHLV